MDAPLPGNRITPNAFGRFSGWVAQTLSLAIQRRPRPTYGRHPPPTPRRERSRRPIRRPHRGRSAPGAPSYVHSEAGALWARHPTYIARPAAVGAPAAAGGRHTTPPAGIDLGGGGARSTKAPYTHVLAPSAPPRRPATAYTRIPAPGGAPNIGHSGVWRTMENGDVRRTL